MYIGSAIILDAPDGTIGDRTQVEARFSPFEDIANPNARQMHALHRRYHRLGNYFGHTQWNS